MRRLRLAATACVAYAAAALGSLTVSAAWASAWSNGRLAEGPLVASRPVHGAGDVQHVGRHGTVADDLGGLRQFGDGDGPGMDLADRELLVAQPIQRRPGLVVAAAACQQCGQAAPVPGVGRSSGSTLEPGDQLVVAALQAAVGGDHRLGEDPSRSDADGQWHGGRDDLLGAVQVTVEVGPGGVMVDELDLVVAKVAVAEEVGEAVEFVAPGPQVAPVEVGDGHGVGAAEAHRQATEPAAELQELDTDADALSLLAGVGDHVAHAEQHLAEHLGIVEVAGDRLGARRKLQRLVDVEEEPVGSQVDEEASASGGGLVVEHGEGGFSDDPSLRHRIDETDGAELRDGRGRPYQRRRVAVSLGATRSTRAAWASLPGHRCGGGRTRCGS